MRCLICHKLSLKTFCKICIEKFLKSNIIHKKLGSLEVYSFFSYSEIEELILTKHKSIGYRVYKALAEITIKPFLQEFIKYYNEKIYIIGIDERVENGYSHIALLTNSISSDIEVLQSSLISSNKFKYSGKSLKERILHPRKFIYKNKKNGIKVILIDDIITTGTTLKEAVKKLKEFNIEVIFSLTLAMVI